MREKIHNSLHIQCDDIDLTEISNIEFYVKQSLFFRQYTPIVVSEHEMLVEIPVEDAMQLSTKLEAQLQFAFTDKSGTPRATNIITKKVGDLLKEAGYGTIQS